MDKKGEIKLSDFCESVDFVVLQPNNAWFFPEYYIESKVLNNFVLFVDQFKGAASMGVFKRTGEFFLKLEKRGKGPGEYNGIDDFGMDPAEKRFWVLEGYKAVLHWYDLQGNWIESIKLPINVTHVWILPDGNILAQNTRWEPDSFDETRLFVTDKTGRLTGKVWI